MTVDPAAQSPKTGQYPDVLGAITGGRRLVVDAVQLAAAVIPSAGPAGMVFHAVVPMQSTVNIPVDAVVHLIIPEKDVAGHPGRITTPVLKPLRIGLLPGEVGYISLPFLTEHRTEPGKGYVLQIDIQVEYAQQGGKPVRDARGGIPLDVGHLDKDRQQRIAELQTVAFSVEKTGKALLRATLSGLLGDKVKLNVPFEVLPPAIARFEPRQKADYIRLWTEADIADETALISKARPLVEKLLPFLTRDSLFMPLLKATQWYFERAQYPLHSSEALLITKLLILAVERNLPKPGSGVEKITYPQWFIHLCRRLISQPEAANPNALEQLIARDLYPDFVFEAALWGFSILEPTLRKHTSLPGDVLGYTHQLHAGLTGVGKPLTIIRAYLPLVLAGLAVNSRLTTSQENIRTTCHAFAEALEQRKDERKAGTQFIFDIAEDLLQQGLEHA